MDTDFGFKAVPKNEKPNLVRDLFNNVADKYDLMNDVMSLGLHRHWKTKFIHLLPSFPNIQMLDVASGSGDIIQKYMQKMQKLQCEYNVTAFDCSKKMLEKSKARLIDKNLWENVEWIEGMAETLPFEDQQFDLYTIAFGLRNVTDKLAALQEAYRVLKPAGSFLCLEFSHVHSLTLQRIYDAYSFKCIPMWGKWLAKNEKAYQYLVESIRTFPKPEDLSLMMEEAGFRNVYHILLAGGIAAIHIGLKQ